MTNIPQSNGTEVFRKRKSVVLTKEDWSRLKKFHKAFNTDVECAIAIGVDRNVLKSILLKGSGSPDSIEKIKSVITEQ